MKNVIFYADALNDVGSLGGSDSTGLLSHPYAVIAGGAPILILIGYIVKSIVSYFSDKGFTVKKAIEGAKVPTVLLFFIEALAGIVKLALYAWHGTSGS